eukprot:9367655-Pyramimonas_sp.AAC.1
MVGVATAPMLLHEQRRMQGAHAPLHVREQLVVPRRPVTLPGEGCQIRAVHELHQRVPDGLRVRMGAAA